MTDRKPTLADFEAFASTDEYRSLHLFERIQIADHFLPMRQSQYRVVWEDPEEPLDTCCKVQVPDPHWLAQAMHGGVLPPIEAYLADHKVYADYLASGGDPAKFNWNDVGGAKHPYAAPIGPMTEEEAIEYLIKKDIPQRVWDDPFANQPRFKIVRTESIPKERYFRNAWRIAA